ncbi:MAG: signal recognition particle-docking protein FtsY [Synechococcus sp.]
MAEFDWFQRSATPPPAEADPQQDSLAWAREAYARLKAQQQTAAPEVAPEPEPTPEPEPEPQLTPEPEPSLLELAMAQRQERLAVLQTPEAPAVEDRQGDGADPSLGALDDAFLWSAEVLAAQGRSVDDVSLEEIDWLSRLRRGMEKTRQGFVTGLLERLGTDPLSGETLDEIESLLLRADVGVQATDRLLDRLRRRMNETVLEGPEALDLLRSELRQLLDAPLADGRSPLLAPRRGVLNIWLLVGVNGVGKTTTLGKLAHLAVRSGYSCLIAAGDTFRAAAVQQLQVWADRSAVPLIANPSANADPAAVVYDAIGAARSRGSELLLVDTAGRLQTKNNLMEELAKVRRIVDRLAPEACVESLLVLDASQGQNGLRQAMAFAPAAGLSGVVLTKLDGTARGGVALAVAAEAGLPIRFIGAGEGLRDLRPFNSFEFVEALLAR